MKKLFLFVVAALMTVMTYANDAKSTLMANVVLSDGLTYCCQVVAHTLDSITLVSPYFEREYGNSVHTFGVKGINQIDYLEMNDEAVFIRKNHFFTEEEYKLWREEQKASKKAAKASKKEQRAIAKTEAANEVADSETTEEETEDDAIVADNDAIIAPSKDSIPFTYELFTQYIERRQNTPLHKLNNTFLSKGYHGQLIVGSGYGQFIGIPISVSTIQGWRFNPIVFVGGGITLNFDCGGNNMFTMPMFADLQISIPARFETIYLVWDTQLGASPWCVMGEKQNYQPNAPFKVKARGGVYFSTGLNFMFGVKDGVSIGFKGQFVLLQNGYQGPNGPARIGVGGLGCFVVAY